MGLPVVNVKMHLTSNSVNFSTKSIGIIDYIWPIDNTYHTIYQTKTYSVDHYSKIINQGRLKGELGCNYLYEKAMINCNNTLIPKLDSSVQNIFTLLAMVSKKSQELVDAIWIPMDHEGAKFKGRFIFIDTLDIKLGNQNILCEHYRLDIIPVDSNNNKFVSDYFMDHIALENTLRQLWISKNNPRRIVKASVELYGIKMLAEIILDNI